MNLNHQLTIRLRVGRLPSVVNQPTLRTGAVPAALKEKAATPETRRAIPSYRPRKMFLEIRCGYLLPAQPV